MGSIMPLIILEQAAQVQAAGELGHIVGGLAVGSAHSLVDGGDDPFLSYIVNAIKYAAGEAV